MDDHSDLRTMIANGRDKIEWYRQVDPGMLRTLQDMIKAPNFKENMAAIVKTIYEFAFITYAGKKLVKFSYHLATFSHPRFASRTNQE